MAEGSRLGTQLTEKITEMFVQTAHYDLYTTPEGVAGFGVLCEMGGRCCAHLAMGRREQALEIARTVGQSIPHAFPEGEARETLEMCLGEIIALLELPDVDQLH